MVSKKAAKQVKFNLPPTTTSSSTLINIVADAGDAQTTISNGGICHLCAVI